MYIGCLHAVVQQELCQFLSHSLGQGCDKYSLIAMGTGKYLVEQVVYLVLAGAYFYLWVKQTCRTNKLFNYNTLRLSQLVVGGSGAYIDGLMYHAVKLIEGKRTVVEGCWQTETIFHQVLLAGAVATIHSSYLRNADMTLVYYQQEVFGEEVEQAVGTFALMSTVEVPRIVLDTRAMSQFLDHLHVVFHSFLDALCLDVVAQILKELLAHNQIILYHAYGFLGLFLGGDKEVGRINFIGIKRNQPVIGERVHLLDRVYLVVPPGNSQHIVTISHEDIYSFALDTEVATLQFDIVSYIQGIH